MSLVKLIDQAIGAKSLIKFQSIIQMYQNDINRYVIVDRDSDTLMNILHIMAARPANDPQAVIEDVLYKFINTMRTMDNFDVNYRATIERVYNITAAHIAVQWRNVPMLKALIRHGCDLLICDCNGQNVQDIAQIVGDDILIRLIKDAIYESIENRFLSSPKNFIGSIEDEDCDYVKRTLHDDEENSSQIHSLGSSLSSSGMSSTSGYAKSPPSCKSLNMSFVIGSPCCITSHSELDTQITENDSSSLQCLSLFNQAYDQSTIFRVEDRDSIDDNYREEKTNNSNNASFSSQTIETVFKDDEVELVEERYQSVSSSDITITDLANNLNEYSSSISSQSLCNDDHSAESSRQSIDEFILNMNDVQLFQELNQIGFNPGPVTDQTRKYYQRKFQLLRNELNQNKNTHPIESEDAQIIAKMTNYNIQFDLIRSCRFPFEEAQNCENLLIEQFQNQCEDNNYGKQTHFVYLLLDPSKTENLPVKVNLLLNGSKHLQSSKYKSFTGLFAEILNANYILFYQFVASIFYVGKGQNNRPYQHLIEAYKECQMASKTNVGKLNITPKTKRINEIWKQGFGPISLHFFQGITSDEAFTREALIIDTLSLFNLTNQISGTYRCSLELNQRQKGILGTYLLFKFFIIYLLNGERQIKINSI